jgi:hypothetical protein
MATGRRKGMAENKTRPTEVDPKAFIAVDEAVLEEMIAGTLARMDKQYPRDGKNSG